MNCQSKSAAVLGGLFCVLFLSLSAGRGLAQVNPSEILNPQLKAAEEKYFQQLIALNRAIVSTKFPFPFFLSRYVGLDPRKQAEADTRGLEFVNFDERVVLKATGNYNVAYNADLLTQNQRASRTFQEVIVPILQLFPKYIPTDVACDSIGFELSYHVRRQTRNYDYEGKEILVAVFDKADALGYLSAQGDSERQEILNRSQIFLNGEEFGLALGQTEPLNLAALGRSVPREAAAARTKGSSATGSGSDARLSRINAELPPGFRKPDTQTVGGPTGGALSSNPGLGSDKPETQAAPARAATPADAERLQAKYQPQLEALAKDGAAKFQFVDYAPPSFVIFRKQVFLQLTIRNSLHFDKDSTSIYKRAAQSFDLFLAPQLKVLVEKLPGGEDYDGLDITLLNQFGSKSGASSEALEFVCPLKPLRQFVDAEITNQELINQSVVLVNGVRVALTLQQVE